MDRRAERTSKWMESEIVELKEAVDIHGTKDWIYVAAHVVRRTHDQCRNRWLDALAPTDDQVKGRTGKWAADEENKLKEAVEAHGDKDWVAVAAMVPGRTKKQCVDRWTRSMDPNRSIVWRKRRHGLNKSPTSGRNPQLS
jgi:hypothetical protein